MKIARISGAKISKEEINALPLYHYMDKVTLVHTQDALAEAIGRLRKAPVVGLDTETRPSFRKGRVNFPTLVQMAVPGEVFLFHLGWVPLGPELAGIFEDQKIIKAGMAIDNDFRYLSRLHSFVPQSVLDLAQVAKRHGVEIQSLRGLAAYFLQLHISKTEQCSNWAKKELTPRQIRYAATDAWASLSVYERMQEQGLIASKDIIPVIPELA